MVTRSEAHSKWEHITQLKRYNWAPLIQNVKLQLRNLYFEIRHDSGISMRPVTTFYGSFHQRHTVCTVAILISKPSCHFSKTFFILHRGSWWPRTFKIFWLQFHSWLWQSIRWTSRKWPVISISFEWNSCRKIYEFCDRSSVFDF